MNNYFEQEILSLERELRNLKTSSQKSGGIIRTYTTSRKLMIPLEWSDVSSAGGYGAARALRYYEFVSDYDAFIIPTLDWYHEDINTPFYDYTKREIRMICIQLTNNNFGVELYITGSEVGANCDAARLKRGEQVVVSVTLTATSTNDCLIREYSM